MANKEEPLPAAADNVDIREQLFNDGKTGKTKVVSYQREPITRLRGILIDIDQKLFLKSSLVPEPGLPLEQFYERYLSQWLDNHPTLAKAEVRNTGGGFHVLLRPDVPIEFLTGEERDQWRLRTRIIRCILPLDPQAPDINAMTRPVGSINSKYGAEVKLVRAGVGIPKQELLDLVAEMSKAPFRTIVKALTGQERMNPCPVCQEASLSAGDKVGICYGCKKKSIPIRDLIGALIHKEGFTALTRDGKEVAHAE